MASSGPIVETPHKSDLLSCLWSRSFISVPQPGGVQMHRVTTRETLFIACVTTRKTLFVSPSFSMSSGQDQGEQNRESTARALPEDKVLTENNGEIGYFLKKGSEFFPVTNFSVHCVGYVAETPQSGSSEGFLFKVSPKTSIVSGAQDEEPVAADPESSQQYYLTWRDMSTQQGILSKIPSKKLWTLPSKDQYLPAYFKRLCDEYVNSGNSRRLFPVECHGLQRDSFPPTWVIGSNLHVVPQDDRADRIHERVSPYAVLGDEVSPLPIVDIGEESLLDDGAGLRELILIQEKYLGDNFPATLLMLGGLGIGIHYEQLRSLYDGVPLIMAFGSPVSGKSLAVQMAMSLLNIRESIGAFSQTSKKAINSSQVTVEIQDENDADDTVSEKNTQALNQTSVKSTNSQVTVDIQNENDADDAILVKSTQEFESATATATSSKTGTEEDSTHLDQDDLDKLNFDKEIYERSEALRAAELRRKREFESATATATSSKTETEEEIRDQHKAQSKRKKGSVRNEASNLVDGIHPGIMHKKLRSRK